MISLSSNTLREDQHVLSSTPTHKWIPLLCPCFYICVVFRHTSPLDLKQVPTQDITHQVRKKDEKQRMNGVFHSRFTNSLSGGASRAADFFAPSLPSLSSIKLQLVFSISILLFYLFKLLGLIFLTYNFFLKLL